MCIGFVALSLANVYITCPWVGMCVYVCVCMCVYVIVCVYVCVFVCVQQARDIEMTLHSLIKYSS